MIYSFYTSSFYAYTLFFIALITYYILKKRPLLDEPVSFALLLYFLYFVISPIYDILTKNTTMGGVNLLSYYPKTQLISTIGIVSFLITYEKTNITLSKRPFHISSHKMLINALVWEFIGLLGYFIWTRKLGVSLFVINPFKLSNAYLMLGETSKKATGYLALSILFLVPSTLMFLELALRKVIKFTHWMVFLINFTLFLTRGVRYIILIAAGSMAVYYLKRTQKHLKRSHIIILTLFSIFIFTLVSYLRGSPSLSHLSLNTAFLLSFFTSSISLFKPTAAVVHYIPKYHPFVMGETFLYTFLMPIPRIIWPQKPYPAFLKILWKITGGRFFGYAVPNIGEYYANFGIPGIIFFMAILGGLLKVIYNIYKKNAKNELVLMSYSIFLFFIFQIVSRGYFPQVFVQSVYLFAPLFSLYIIQKL